MKRILLPVIIALFGSVLLSAQGSPTPTSAEEEVIQWSEAIKSADWRNVYRLGSAHLKSEEFLRNPTTARYIGFTWFAAYIEARSGRIDQNPLDAISKAVDLIPDQSEVWYEFGVELNRQGKFDDAVKALQHYLVEVPLSGDGQYELAYSFNSLDRPKEALPLLQNLYRESPANPHVLSELAFTLNALLDGEKAENILLELVKLQPKDYGAWLELSHSYRLTGKWDLALNALEQSVKLGLSIKQSIIEHELIKTRKTGKWKTAVK